MPGLRPLARNAGLITEEVDGELLVYDAQSDIACRLNASAALVWRSSDGRRTVDDLVAVLSEELGELADVDMVMIALDHLTEHGLIQSGYDPREATAARLTRRRFIRRVGVVGAASMAVPVVHSMVVPTPAAAQSGGYPAYYPLNNQSLLSR